MRSPVLNRMRERFNKESWLYRMRVHWTVELYSMKCVGIRLYLKKFKFKWDHLNPKYKL